MSSVSVYGVGLDYDEQNLNQVADEHEHVSNSARLDI